MHDVTCLGELLIDFTSLDAGASLIETPGFEKHAGGAPANVAVGVSRLGGSSAFLGMVGDDEFGRYLAQVLADRGVNTAGLRYSDEANTTLAFVALREDGEREFIFYRNPGADMLYGPGDLDEQLIADGRFLHHGSISFISEPNREATLRAISLAKANGNLISYDPNLRLNLWDDAMAAHAGVLLGLPSADILKVSEDELQFITMQMDTEAGMKALHEQGVPVVVVTLGSEGCAYLWGDVMGRIPAPTTTPVDTTGAGDAFVAGMLYRLARANVAPTDLGRDEIADILAFANSVAAHVVTRRGAIPAMPTQDELTDMM
ncbi:MAG TPA: PfkB family carbohydrate kinase [Armatimonadota bacterium]|nr:PfkB family carbohydrate kinase [Armatimonadota bacterium]